MQTVLLDVAARMLVVVESDDRPFQECQILKYRRLSSTGVPAPPLLASSFASFTPNHRVNSPLAGARATLRLFSFLSSFRPLSFRFNRVSYSEAAVHGGNQAPSIAGYSCERFTEV